MTILIDPNGGGSARPRHGKPDELGMFVIQYQMRLHPSRGHRKSHDSAEYINDATRAVRKQTNEAAVKSLIKMAAVSLPRDRNHYRERQHAFIAFCIGNTRSRAFHLMGLSRS